LGEWRSKFLKNCLKQEIKKVRLFSYFNQQSFFAVSKLMDFKNLSQLDWVLLYLPVRCDQLADNSFDMIF